MKRILIPAIGFIFVIMLIAGCEEQSISQTTPSSKKLRLIAVENMRLKEQLIKRDTAIENLKGDVVKQKELLSKCEDKNKALSLRNQKKMQSFFLKALQRQAEKTEE